MSGSDERARRLAAQLRANLKRRKAQARAIETGSAEGAREPDPADREHDRS